MSTEDPNAHRFLGSGVEAPFEALSRQGSGAYQGLETFPNPGCELVTYTSDEVVAKCPVTGQPDYYTCEITLKNAERLIESKSLKLYFNNIHEATFTKDFGIFCEALAVYLRGEIAEAVGSDEDDVRVVLAQKSRGGISIKAMA
jgi:NADPH-dependent 7-cyano-7-deazaguanine reductase QueF